LRTLRREGLGLAGVVVGVAAGAEAGALVPHFWPQAEVEVGFVVVLAVVFESLIILMLSVQSGWFLINQHLSLASDVPAVRRPVPACTNGPFLLVKIAAFAPFVTTGQKLPKVGFCASIALGCRRWCRVRQPRCGRDLHPGGVDDNMQL
jgi:hypothetical protein